jgi:hypothetical protein
MSEKKNLDDAVDKLETAVDPNTVISIGGYNFTPAKLMIAGTIVTSILGGLYGSFEVYKDYMDMKQKIQEYVTPDLGEIYKKLELLEANTNKAVDYTNEIKNDLKQDLRRTENVVENMERSNKEMQRDIDKSIATARTEMRSLQKEVDVEMNGIKREVDRKIKQALDNPLANQ